MDGNSKNMILAKTLKIVLPARRNANFQEIEDRKNEKNQAKVDEKSHVFWNIDFDRILRGFWEGFDRPKPLIFAFFSAFFRSKFSMIFWKAKKSKKLAQPAKPIIENESSPGPGLHWGIRGNNTLTQSTRYPSCLRQVSAPGRDSEVSWLQYHPSGESTELALELYSLREGGLFRMLFITQCLRWAPST